MSLSDLASSAKRSSLGAMMGKRSGGFPETLLRRFCITTLTVIRLGEGEYRDIFISQSRTLSLTERKKKGK